MNVVRARECQFKGHWVYHLLYFERTNELGSKFPRWTGEFQIYGRQPNFISNLVGRVVSSFIMIFLIIILSLLHGLPGDAGNWSGWNLSDPRPRVLMLRVWNWAKRKGESHN